MMQAAACLPDLLAARRVAGGEDAHEVKGARGWTQIFERTGICRVGQLAFPLNSWRRTILRGRVNGQSTTSPASKAHHTKTG